MDASVSSTPAGSVAEELGSVGGGLPGSTDDEGLGTVAGSAPMPRTAYPMASPITTTAATAPISSASLVR